MVFVVVVVVLVTVVEAAFEMKWIDATCSSLKWPPVFNVFISSRRLPAFGSRSGNRNIPWSRLSWCARMCWRCWKTSLSFNVFSALNKSTELFEGWHFKSLYHATYEVQDVSWLEDVSGFSGNLLYCSRTRTLGARCSTRPLDHVMTMKLWNPCGAIGTSHDAWCRQSESKNNGGG